VLGVFVFISVFVSKDSNFLLAYSRNNIAGMGGPEESFAGALSVLSPSLIPEEASADTAQNNTEPIPESVLGSAAVTGASVVSPYPSENDKKMEELAYFIFPVVRGKNWGLLHHYNAVDIAGNCGAQILAAADGVVIDVASNNTWNGGYGNFILIEHPNKTRTRYAHTLKNTVAKGDVVHQGDKIGLVGNTGNVDGTSGCHVHFEVYGAQNPFVK
jgi:murein DD-endopeptidase MepM/ murein hydrolase activator NlpD